jgi:hypothetical protein
MEGHCSTGQSSHCSASGRRRRINTCKSNRNKIKYTNPSNNAQKSSKIKEIKLSINQKELIDSMQKVHKIHTKICPVHEH